MNNLIFRDDDASKDSDLSKLMTTYRMLNDAAIIHTVAVICKGLDKKNDIVEFLKLPGVDPQIHCWEHIDLTTISHLRTHLKWCLSMFKRCGLKRPTTLYCPWNKSSHSVVAAAATFNITVSTEKISLSGYLKCQTGKVINFHSWSDEMIDLPEVIKKYKATL